MTTWTDIRTAILNHFKTNWDFDSAPVQYQNKDFIQFGSSQSPLNLNDDSIESYVRLSLEPVIQQQFEFNGADGNTRTTAYFIMMVMTRKNKGTLFFSEVYDRLSELYVNKNISGARLTRLEAAPYVYEDNFTTQTLTMTITFENIQ